MQRSVIIMCQPSMTAGDISRLLDLKNWGHPKELENMAMDRKALEVMLKSYPRYTPGMEIASIGTNYRVINVIPADQDKTVSLAYECGLCDSVVIGPPKIEPFKDPVDDGQVVLYICGSCKNVMHIAGR